MQKPNRKPSVKPKAEKGSSSGSESLASKAYEQIRDEILRGSLAVGDVLSRRRLAEKLNMSFLPITEALQRLESDGLVESRPRIGTRVRIPTKQGILDSFEIREALETQAARLCCEYMTDTDREQLIVSAQHLDKLFAASAGEKGPSRFLFSVQTYHMQFHMHVAGLAKAPGLLRAIEKEQVLIFNWLYDTATQQNSLPANFHYELAVALSSGDLLKADSAMRKHIRFGRERVVGGMVSLEISDSWRLKRNS